jgi:two-component system sensor histidine kinase TctE
MDAGRTHAQPAAQRHQAHAGRRHLAVRIVRDESFVAMTISDSGPGVSDELSARLYQPFSAGDVRHGSGLGLAICREIVETMHGSITLENRVVHGQVTGLDAVVRLPTT